MITLAWVIGWIVAYLAAGIGVAVWDMPHLHERLTHSNEWTKWQARTRAARGFAFFTMLTWPVRGPYLAVARLADKHNPVLIAQELRRREQAVIDRELAIKRLELQMQKELDDPREGRR